MRLRMTAYSLASLRGRPAVGSRDTHPHLDPEPARLRNLTAEMERFYDRVAAQVDRPAHGDPPPAGIPPLPVLDTTVLAAAIPAAATPTAATPAGTEAAAALAVPAPTGADDAHPHAHPYMLWVREHLYHLRQHLDGMVTPALHVAELRRAPWWR